MDNVLRTKLTKILLTDRNCVMCGQMTLRQIVSLYLTKNMHSFSCLDEFCHKAKVVYHPDKFILSYIMSKEDLIKKYFEKYFIVKYCRGQIFKRSLPIHFTLERHELFNSHNTSALIRKYINNPAENMTLTDMLFIYLQLDCPTSNSRIEICFPDSDDTELPLLTYFPLYNFTNFGIASELISFDCLNTYTICSSVKALKCYTEFVDSKNTTNNIRMRQTMDEILTKYIMIMTDDGPYCLYDLIMKTQK